MSGAFEIVMSERRALVDKIIGMMQQGYFFNKEEWDRGSLRPQNPLSKIQYKGGNRPAADGYGRRERLYGSPLGDCQTVFPEGLLHQKGRAWSPL